MESKRTLVLADAGVFKGVVYQCIRCHTVYLLEGPDDYKALASEKHCCQAPYIVPLSIEVFE
jgi:hypothetical protein